MTGHLGILGGGQLGRMLALAAHRLGLPVRVLDPDPAAPARAVAPTRTAAWDDDRALDWLTDGATAITWEREDVPADVLRRLATRAPVQPDPAVLLQVQDRATQKRLVRSLGLDTAPWLELDPGAPLGPELHDVELPAVVKARRGGFDGRGQHVVRNHDELVDACRAFAICGSIVEPLVAFDDEVAILAVRSRDGMLRTWEPVLTRQVDGQLANAEAPHPATDRIEAPALGIAQRIGDALGHVGVFAVECFRIGERLVVNEIAPRVHNSGHWTAEGSACGQFEQHVRAVFGLPLGDCRLLGPTALVNYVGRLPDPTAVLAVPGTTLTVYGKAPRPGRKLGHVSVLARDRAELRARVAQLPNQDAACVTTTTSGHPVTGALHLGGEP